MRILTLVLAMALALVGSIASGSIPLPAFLERIKVIDDPPGDVSYSPAYPGARDHAYLDILALEWGYDAAADAAGFTMHGADYTLFGEPAPGDMDVICQIRIEITLDGDSRGRILLRVDSAEPDAPFRAQALLLGSGGSAGEAVPVAHTFRADFSAPGRLEFTIERAYLANYGDTLAAPTVVCAEQYSPQRMWPDQPLPPNGGTLGNPISNSDGAANASAVPLLLRSLAPEDGPDVDGDGLPDGESPALSPSNGGPTPALSVAVALLAVALGTGWVRTRRR